MTQTGVIAGSSAEPGRTLFLILLSCTGNVSLSAQSAGLSRQLVCHWRDTDQAFAAGWTSATDQFADHLRYAAFRRGVEGRREPVFYQGVQIGERVHYSDPLLLYLLQLADTESGPATSSESEAERDQLLAQIAAQMAVLGTPDDKGGADRPDSEPDTGTCSDQTQTQTQTQDQIPALQAAVDPARLLARLTTAQLLRLRYDWSFWAREKQLPPPGDWRVWLLLAGRGFGKTRCGAEWVRWLACHHPGLHIALVSETFDDARYVMVEGPSGILSVTPARDRPRWTPSARTLDWPNGTVMRLYSAERPDQLRGPEFDYAWADEVGKWRFPAAWDNLMLGLRRGRCPRVLATTTPRPKRWLAALAADPATCLVTGTSAENEHHLPPGFVATVRRGLATADLARQELDGALVMAHPGALWDQDALAALIAPAPGRDAFVRVMVGVDPAVQTTDETGIIIAGRARDGGLWVLEDLSCRLPPDRWADRVCRAAARWRAEAIVVEVNQGGALVRQLLTGRSDPQGGRPVPVRQARAIKDKASRALPVAAAYARDEVRHAADFTALCDQMAACVPGQTQTPSPDRLDALVWALGSLLTGLSTSAPEFRL